MTTREQAAEQTDRALFLAGMCRVVFEGEEPECVGAALAETMATFLRSHRIVGDTRGERDMREAVFQHWIKTVHDLLLIYDKPPVGTQ
jgi:hypothetical protein